MNKKCSVCKEIKDISEFNQDKTRKNGLNYKCKSCRKEYRQKNQKHIKEHDTQYYQKNKEKIKKQTQKYRINHKQQYKKYNQDRVRWFKDYKKTLKCKICGEDRPEALCFHHKNPKEKKYDIGEMVITHNQKEVILEITKCDILCINCHTSIHSNINNKKYNQSQKFIKDYKSKHSCECGEDRSIS